MKLELAPVTCCAPGAPPLKASEFEALSARFKALADPTRLAVVNRLASRGEACVCEFNTLGLSQPTISHHLRVLREAGLIEVAHKRKTWVFYRLVPEAVEALAFALGGAPQPEFVLATAEGTVAR
jgi:ArsR family transcriptional regulator, arsenate/arsenite/antimonite-responsive transcriptional repressor